MPDPRITKLAKVMVHYSLALKPGQQCLLRTHPLAEELTLAVYEEAVKAGAFVTIMNSTPGADEIFFKHASDAQLDYVSPIRKLIAESFDASLVIWSEHNTRSLSGIDGRRMARAAKAGAPISKIFLERAAKKELRWCLTVYPTHAMAQEADMSLSDYREFVFGAMMLNEDDPAAYWKKIGQEQQKWVDWLKGRDKVALKGSNVDLSLSIKERVFIPCDGQLNFPDGEIFTGPVEDSVNGWIRFKYPAIEYGQEVTDIQLWFEKGKVVKETATKNQELLTAQLNTDAGSRTLGEFGIGVNYGITRFTKNMLFDEKMGGTIHLAVGSGYPESGSKNDSGIHWDMLCDMNDAEITVDGELFYKNGKAVV
ncbi:MAG: aminopeptidase [Anaerolineae bacterium CG17_big_fil_post_rev_8_21_14_2_50_57_27]|nr:MAG: aminopeptidase [Anaerolineae bacterium CG06_land_8_20_14_3_00_57_67]PIW20526.1 MAG: aminopeptidase [Anaerolineae bacterium CG17_big_fil_post_rev_8_21_14_2_50_57_27]